MANTYSRIYIHVTCRVKGKSNLIAKEWKEDLFKCITGIATNKKQKLIAINGVEDHIHMLLGIKPNVTLSDVVRDIKANASRFINERGWTKGRFEWQEGFGAFSCGYSQLDMVINYIRRQEEHHKKISYREEYITILDENGVEFELKYAFGPEDEE